MLLFVLVLLFYAHRAYGDFLQSDLEAYCLDYARAVPGKLLNQPGNQYVEGSVKVSRLIYTGWLENLFSPPDAQFYGGYKCRFSIRRKDKDAVSMASVKLLLVNTAHHARYTQWKDLQIIPIKAIYDTDEKRTGYIVVKYLDGLQWKN